MQLENAWGGRYFKDSRQSRQSLGGVRVPLVQQHPRPERPAQCPPATDQDPHMHACFQGFGLDIRPLLNRPRPLRRHARQWPFCYLSVPSRGLRYLSGSARCFRRDFNFSQRESTVLSSGTCSMPSLIVDHSGHRLMSIAQCSSQNSPASAAKETKPIITTHKHKHKHKPLSLSAPFPRRLLGPCQPAPRQPKTTLLPRR